jgi:hypothetical protein
MGKVFEGGFGKSNYYKSDIPIQIISDFVDKKYKLSGFSASHGKYYAILSFHFIKKYKKIRNPNFSFLSILSRNRTPIFIKELIKTDNLDIMDKIEQHLIKIGYNNINCTLKNGFTFKTLSDKEKEIKAIKEKIHHF